MAATRNAARVAELRRLREQDPGDEYAAAIGMITAVVRPDTHPGRTVQQVRDILDALDEVTGYRNWLEEGR
ncbi:MAG: hypothetical protein ACM30G_04415 [Micromonosporaceae bacterium]